MTMNNPISIWKELKENYLRYLKTAIPLVSSKLDEEREALLNDNVSRDKNVLWHQPYFELMPTYPQGKRLAEIGSLPKGFADFAKLGLFTPEKLYEHQQKAIEAVEEGKHIVVSTGTGSGKTECFMLPLFAHLIRVKKRDNTRAVKAIMLYPLNALVEDQLGRLRRACNLPGTRDSIESMCGEKITFARYTGVTPKDDKDDVAQKLRSTWGSIKKELAGKNSDEAADLQARSINTDADSAELWNREQILECNSNPDILITNYSMLNVMLMRQQEKHIFENTKKWLKCKDNVLYLIIDELHTYWGTTGTEVALLLRQLLDRLGLKPESKQIRFIATSASLAQDNRGFIEKFFGVPESGFEFIENPEPVKPEDTDKLDISFFNGDPNKIDVAEAKKLCEDNKLCERVQHAFYEKDSTGRGKYAVLKMDELAKCIFREDAEKDPVEALDKLLCIIKKAGDAKLTIPSMRIHYFFRNIDMLYACSNPDCNQVADQYKDKDLRRIGKLYLSPVKRCKCGAKVYPLAICRTCGEIALEGYRKKEAPQMELLDSIPPGENAREYVKCFILPKRDVVKLPDDKGWCV